MWLFDTTDFISRAHCAINGWPPYLKFSNQCSNLGIWGTYLWIACWLCFFWIKKKDERPRSNIVLLFAGFICFCALTHFGNFLAFTFPAYRLFTLVDVVTFIMSLLTAISLPSVISYTLKTPSIEKLIEAREVAQHELTRRELLEMEQLQLIKQLTLSVTALESELSQHKWIDAKYKNIEIIKNLLNGVN